VNAILLGDSIVSSKPLSSVIILPITLHVRLELRVIGVQVVDPRENYEGTKTIIVVKGGCGFSGV